MDIDTDCGDAGALSLGIGLHLANDIQLIACLSSSSNTKSAPAIRNCLDVNGLTGVQVGAYQGSNGTNTSPYTSQIVTRFGTSSDTRANYTDAVTVLRTVLAAAPSRSVDYVCTGFGFNVEGLLKSSADGISGLTGPQLMSAKLNKMSFQAGDPVTPTNDWNMGNASGATGVSASAQYIFQNLPGDIPVFMIDDASPVTVLCGPPNAADPLLSPIKYAYNLFGGGNTRSAWDEMTLLCSLDGPSATYFTSTYPNGQLSVDTGTGILSWSSSAGQVTYCYSKVSDATIAAHIRGIQATVL